MKSNPTMMRRMLNMRGSQVSRRVTKSGMNDPPKGRSLRSPAPNGKFLGRDYATKSGRRSTSSATTRWTSGSMSWSAHWRSAIERRASGMRREGLGCAELARLFPALWDTTKAAERWIAKNPPEAIRDIIRVWRQLDNEHGAPALVVHAKKPME